MLDMQLFGEKPGAQHLVSLGFHIVNTLLLFLLLRRMTGAIWRSGMVAALFALHPLHVESVAWISERKDVLSAFFFLLTLGAYVRYAECGMRNAECGMQQPDAGTKHQASRFTFHVSRFKRVPASAWYLLALVCFALGLMSKPMLVTLPFVLLLLDFWPLRRMQRAEDESRITRHWPRLTFHAAVVNRQSPWPIANPPPAPGESPVLPAGSRVERGHVHRAAEGRGGLDQPVARGAGCQRGGFLRPVYRQDVLAEATSRFSTRTRAIGRRGR